MKKTRQTVTHFLSLIIILVFTTSAFAEDSCIIKWWADSDTCTYDPNGSSCDYTTCEDQYQSFSPAGIIATTETSRNQTSALALYNEAFSNWGDPSIDSSCVSYFYVAQSPGSGYIDISVCLDGSWHRYFNIGVGGFTCTEWDMEANGGWDVLCGPDADNDTLPDIEDSDTVYGTISGAVQEGVTVSMYRPNCGGDVLLDTATTDANGYYAFGNLEDGLYTIKAEHPDYTFIPSMDHPKIPQAEIKSYDFMTRFIDNGDGTVTDNITGLVWLKNASCVDPATTWEYSMPYATGLNDGECGLSDGSAAGDWRLPTIEELQGIGTDPPATWDEGSPPVTWTKPGTPFVNLRLGYLFPLYWSSTEYNNYQAWAINIRNGYVSWEAKSQITYEKFWAWPVRDPN